MTNCKENWDRTPNRSQHKADWVIWFYCATREKSKLILEINSTKEYTFKINEKAQSAFSKGTKLHCVLTTVQAWQNSKMLIQSEIFITISTIKTARPCVRGCRVGNNSFFHLINSSWCITSAHLRSLHPDNFSLHDKSMRWTANLYCPLSNQT